MPVEDRTGLSASITGAATVSMRVRRSVARSAATSGSACEAEVTATWLILTPARTASAMRCTPSSSSIPSASPRAAARYCGTIAFCRLVIATCARIALWYDGLGVAHDEGSADQEVRGRDWHAESGAAAAAPEGDQTGARARRSERERGVPGRQGTAAAGRSPHLHAAETRVG